MKRGFTLVEMLIVVVVLVTLMSITFKLSSVGDEQTRRNNTINKLQRVENCLSGYYAAFGSYPPVKLHGSRDYNQGVNSHGFQNGNEKKLSLNWYTDSGKRGIGTSTEIEDWKQVRAACQSQPFAARYPYPEGYNEVIIARSELAKELLASGEDSDTSAEHKSVVNAGYDDGYTTNPGRHDLTESDWTESQLFQFGLMSFLLPRYFIMMNGDQEFFTKGRQWICNNTLPCDPLGTGRKFASWYEVRQEVKDAMGSSDNEALARIANIPSQAICARWMPNLEGACYCGHDYSKVCFGINITGDSTLHDTGGIGVFAPGGSQSGSTASQYVLDIVTMTDGWHHELYYYSPAPYQSYTVWSAGPNGRTFPPWVSREKLSSAENKCIGVWIDDDIIHMNN